MLTEAEQVFAPKKPKPVKAKVDIPIKANPATIKAIPRKQAATKKAA